MAYDTETAGRVRRLLSGRADVVEKKLMGGLCFMVGGNMACSVGGKGGMLVRVGPHGMDTALKEPHAGPMKMGAKTMTGFVRVTPDGYRSEAALERWIRRGVDFAASLPRNRSAGKRRD